MNRLFKEMMELHAPKMNPDVMNGLACKHIPYALTYLHNIFRTTAENFPVGLTYDGYEVCTPDEEFREDTRGSGSKKREFDIARSDLYMVRFKFSFKGEEVPGRYVKIPFVDEGGILHLSATMYHIYPVLDDKVLSPSEESIFVRLLRDKFIVEAMRHSFVINGKQEMAYVPYAQLHKKDKSSTVAKTTKSVTSLAHYLFGKHGLYDTFKIYTGVTPVVAEDMTGYEGSPDWVVCSSSGNRPNSHISKQYVATKLKIAIPVSGWSSLTKALVLGFFYVVDHFPQRLTLESVTNINLWKILLGHIVFSGMYGENKLFADIAEHYASLDEYMDAAIIKELQEINLNVNNFYELLAYLLAEFNSLTTKSVHTSSQMHGKSLKILYPVLYSITSGFFLANFTLGKLANKKELTMQDIVNTFNKNMRKGRIFSLTSSKNVLEAVSYSADLKYPKITSKITEQGSKPKSPKGEGRSSIGPDKHLNVSQAEAGSILFLSKKNPTPTTHINPYVHLDPVTSTIIHNPSLVEVGRITQAMLKDVNRVKIAPDLSDIEDID